jgi:hypothetical protein
MPLEWAMALNADFIHIIAMNIHNIMLLHVVYMDTMGSG